MNDINIISSSMDKTLKIWDFTKKTLEWNIDIGSIVGIIISSLTDSNSYFINIYFYKYENIKFTDITKDNKYDIISDVSINKENFYDTFFQLRNNNLLFGTKGKIDIFEFILDTKMEPIKHFSDFEGYPLSYCELYDESIVVGLNTDVIMILDNNLEDCRIIIDNSEITGLLQIKDQPDILITASSEGNIKFWNLKTNSFQESCFIEYDKDDVQTVKVFEDNTLCIVSEKNVSFWKGIFY